MRLIDADALLEEAWDVDCRCGYVQVVDVGSIEEAPTIEAKPVVHAHWVDVNPNLHIGMKCSLCGARIKYSEFFNGNHRYCHKCGARMDEVIE